MKLLSIWPFDETQHLNMVNTKKIFCKLLKHLPRTTGPNITYNYLEKNSAPKTPRHWHQQKFLDLLGLALVDSIGFDTY